EHFTPRDVVWLMVDLILAGAITFFQQPGVTLTLSDPCCGTAGMLTIGKSQIEALNPSATVHLFGQEVNPETYAIAKSDLYLKSSDGRDADNIKFGSTLSNDQHSQMRFHCQLANPPYGKDWRLDA
ncbi:N-6 DNA methylase, partial [Arthrospira platensis SPKY1]|nr:N-6 DNA methylase [Arthrospira platensis SPKY1]